MYGEEHGRDGGVGRWNRDGGAPRTSRGGAVDWRSGLWLDLPHPELLWWRFLVGVLVWLC